MSWFNPGAWYWAGLAILVVLVYLTNFGRKRMPVATLPLWQRALARRPAWFILRYWLSLATQILLVLLLVAALSEPYWKDVEAGRRDLVLVLDVSASMSATDVKPSRFAQLKAEARRIVDDLHRRERLSLIAAGSVIRSLCPLTEDRIVLQKALERLAPTDGTSRVAEAVALARRLLAGRPNPQIIVLSDGCFAEAAELSQAADVRWLQFGERAQNVGITRLETRPNLTDPANVEVFVEATNHQAKPAQRTLTVGLQGVKSETAKLEIPAGGAVAKTFRVPAPQGGLLSARVSEDDDLNSDNAAYVLVPRRQRPVVKLVEPAPLALEAGFQVNPRVDFEKVEALPTAKLGAKNSNASPSERPILVLYRQSLTELPPGPLLVIEPQKSCELWEVEGTLRDAASAVKGVRTDSPLLAGVDFASCVVEQAVQLKFRRETETLVTAASGAALVSAVDRPAGRVVVVHINLEKSDLPRRIDFPRLLDNAVRWLSPAAESAAPATMTSEAVVVEPAETARDLAAPDGWKTTVEAGQTHVLLDHAGVWTMSGKKTERAGDSPGGSPQLILTSNLSDAGESEVRPVAGVRSSEYLLSDVGWDQPLWMLLVGFAVVALVAEWCLFHRRVVV